MAHVSDIAISFEIHCDYTRLDGSMRHIEGSVKNVRKTQKGTLVTLNTINGVRNIYLERAANIVALDPTNDYDRFVMCMPDERPVHAEW